MRNKESEPKFCLVENRVFPFSAKQQNIFSNMLERLCISTNLCLICAVRGREEYITGYSGQSVVLKSGADRLWNLTRVQWSIYKNTTYIASLKDGEVIIYNFWRYQGRLELSKETGDLTIRDVTTDDSMTYNMNLVAADDWREQDKVHLTVRGKQS